MVGGWRYCDHYWSDNLFGMQIEGTRAAFAAMISERSVYNVLGVDGATISQCKIYLKQGKSISLDKMEEMLIKVGSIC